MRDEFKSLLDDKNDIIVKLFVLSNHNISADSEGDKLESDVQLLSSKLNTQVHSSDVSAVHWLGKPMVGLVDNSPSILIKFSRRLSWTSRVLLG